MQRKDVVYCEQVNGWATRIKSSIMVYVVYVILYNKSDIHSPATLFAIQYNSSAINSTFIKFMMFSFCGLCLKCVNSIRHFSFEAIVKDAAVLGYIILRGASNFLSSDKIN